MKLKLVAYFAGAVGWAWVGAEVSVWLWRSGQMWNAFMVYWACLTVGILLLRGGLRAAKIR